MHVGVAIDPTIVVAASRDGSATVLTNIEGEVETPQVVGIYANETVIGQRAVFNRMRYPDRTVEIDAAAADAECSLGDTTYSGSDIWARLFTSVKLFIDEDADDVSSVTLVAPDSTTADARQQLIDAADRGQFRVDTVVDRSLVATTTLTDLPAADEVVVCLTLQPETIELSVVGDGPELIKTVREPSLGIQSIVEAVYKHVRSDMLDTGRPDPDEDDALRDSLYDSCHDCVAALAAADESEIVVNLGTNVYSQTLSRPTFLDVAATVTEPIDELLDDLVADIDADVSDVVLIGRHSRSGVAEAVTTQVIEPLCAEQFGVDPLVDTTPGTLARAVAESRDADRDGEPIVAASDADVSNGPASADSAQSADSAEPDAEQSEDSTEFDAEQSEDPTEFDAEQSADSAEPDTERLSVDIAADDPFDVLGLPPDTPLSEVKTRAMTLIDQCDTDDECVAAVSEAFETIQRGPHAVRVGEVLVLPLIVSVEPETILRGDQVTVTVRDIDEPVADVAVTVGETFAGYTDEHGTVTTTVIETGTVDIRATKTHPDDDCEYTAGTETVTVQSVDFGASDPYAVLDVPREATLSTVRDRARTLIDTYDSLDAVYAISAAYKRIEANPHPVVVDGVTIEPLILDVDDHATAGEPIRVSVTDVAGSPVSGVELAVDGDPVDRTTSDGAATVRLDKPGDYEIVATAVHPQPDHEYERATIAVRVGSDSGQLSEPGPDGDSMESASSLSELEISLDTASDELTADDSPPIVRVGEPVQFVVTDTDGQPVESANLTTSGGASGLTDANGRGTITFDTCGETTVRAYSGDVDATMTVAVHRRRVSLTFTTLPENIRVGETVEVGVGTDADEPVCDVVVEAIDGTQAKTDDAGRAYIQFVDTGEKQVTATKSETERVEYESATATVTVRPEEWSVGRSLDLQTVPDTVTVGETIEVAVVADGQPVGDVSIETTGGTQASTDDKGRAYVRFHESGSQLLTATPPPAADGIDLASVTTTVHVHDPE